MIKLISVLSAILTVANLATAQWYPTYGPKSPKAVQINTVVIIGDTIYAGAYRGGIYLSKDGGETWSEVNDGLPWTYGLFTDVISFSIIEDTVIAGTASGIYRSVNYGKTWSEKNQGLPDPPYIYTLAYANGYLFAGTNYGVYRSEDYGVSWEEVRAGLPQNTYGIYLPIESLEFHGGFLFAGTYDGVYRSSSNGDSWLDVNNGIEPNRTSWRPRIATFAGNDSILYAGPVAGGGVYWTKDDGESWSTGYTGLPTFPVGTPMSIWSLALAGNMVFAGTEVGVSCSEDGGESWTDCGWGLPEFPFVSELTVRGNEIIAGTHRGIYRLDNEEMKWDKVFTSHPTSITVQALGKSRSSLFASGYGYGTQDSIFVFRSTDLGDTWSGIDSILVRRLFSTFFESGDTIYGAGSGVFFSENHGGTWISIGDGLPYFVHALLVRDKRLIAGTGGYALQTVYGGVYVSDDHGTSWKLRGLRSEYVTSLAVMEDKIFAGTAGFGWGESGGIYVSNDDGVTWRSSAEGIPAGANIYSLHGYDGNIVAGTSAGIFISQNSGNNWSRSNRIGVPPNAVVNSFVSFGSGILGGSNKGVLISHDNGMSWRPTNSGLSDNALQVLSLEIVGDEVFAGTSDGVWRVSLSALETLRDDQVPSSFQLHRVYPNPFNPTTSIEFSLPQAGMVTLTIYDLLGREVETILNRHMSPGRHKVQWKAGEVPSGIYFVRMQAGDVSQRSGQVFTQTRKVTVLR